MPATGLTMNPIFSSAASLSLADQPVPEIAGGCD
jgi:hypothetical protein